ncbi:unnamed protein product [Diamesa serratosioi]
MSQHIDKIKKIQTNVEQIRNICILAHVDHGKTTLADYLIANNGIISTRNAGPMRYLDNRPDEQERKITMKASNITLYYKSASESEYLINLIDSPGHVDFSSETSAAVRLADGAIVVVDVVEGVCAQTRTILQQAYNENLKPILFLNKIDRLILERNMTSGEAEEHIRRVVEQVNAVMGNIFATFVLSNEGTSDNQESALETADDSKLYFNPIEGNVIFGSAQDGWGFSLGTFANMFSAKLDIPIKELTEFMWGDFFYNSKHKRCDKGAYAKGKTTLFVQMILDNIWSLYKNVVSGEFDKIPAFCEKLRLRYKVPKSAATNRKTILKAMCMEWLSLDKSMLEKIVTHVTSPSSMYETKLRKLLDIKLESAKPEIKFTEDDTAKVIVFIAKMVPITFRELQLCDRSIVNEGDEFFDAQDQVLIAFARVYSGVLSVGSSVHLVKPGYNPKLRNLEEIEEVTIKRVFLMMGRHFEPLEEAHAGMIIGIWGVHKNVVKTGTLSSSYDCPPFSALEILAPPVLRVAVEATNTNDMPKLVKGLRLLNQVDSCVQVLIQDTGEHVLAVLGEVHLEKCIRDLKDSYAKIEINVSKPIVQFRETIMLDPMGKIKNPIELLKDDEKSVTILTRNNTCTIKMVAIPLSSEVVKILEKNNTIVKAFIEKLENNSTPIQLNNELKEMQDLIKEEFQKTTNGVITDNDIWSMGPKKMSSCMLVNKSQYKHLNFWATGESLEAAGPFDRSIINGFQAAVQAGPLCAEPMHGVCFVMLEFKVEDSVEQADSSLSGIIITAVKEACKLAFQKQPQRLVGPMYNLSIMATGDVLGKCYAEISKRDGKVMVSDMIEGSGMWMLEAVIPVIESFDLANELRVKTSGLAMPQLCFSHWETIDLDPFWIPTTEEELEQFGDKSDHANKAKTYMDSIRERKGLLVDKKLVEFAEKQRTLSKNK